MKRFILAVAAVGLMTGAALTPAPAMAAIIDFSFTGTSFDITDGVAITDSSNVVTSLTGIVTGLGAESGLTGTIDALIAPGSPGFGSWNWDGKMFAAANYFTPNSNSSGILFQFDGSNVGNLYLANGSSQIFLSVNTDGALYNPGDPGTLQVAAVPEPATWAMMILGFFGIGFMAYRRKQGGSALSAA
jgi:hypothetical protein